MRTFKIMIAAVAALVTVAVVPAGAAHKDDGTTYYTAELAELNDSGVTGEVDILVQGNRLDVTMVVEGVEPGQVHPQHIHGFDGNDRDATCPTIAVDDPNDGNELIEVAEGAQTYGPVQLSLEPFPTPETDSYVFNQTYTITNADKDFTVQDARDLLDEEIVIHGMTVDGDYWASLPVACGALVADAQG